MTIFAITAPSGPIWDARCRQTLKKHADRHWRPRTDEQREHLRAIRRYEAVERRSGRPAVGYDLAFPGKQIVDYAANETIGRRETT